MAQWKASGLYETLCKRKQVFEEPRKQKELPQLLAEYAKACDPSASGSGALLVAVCRGKLCEGVDLTDRQCRCVIIAGIPYPSMTDLRTSTKRDFLSERSGRVADCMDGKTWYLLQGTQAVGQTVGRVIRHRYDWGAVLLVDERFQQKHMMEAMPAWLTPIQRPEKYGEVHRGLAQFFKNIPDDLEKKANSMMAQRMEVHDDGGNARAADGGWGVAHAPPEDPKESQVEEEGSAFASSARSSAGLFRRARGGGLPASRKPVLAAVRPTPVAQPAAQPA